jgi:hypothetical protein
MSKPFLLSESVFQYSAISFQRSAFSFITSYDKVTDELCKSMKISSFIDVILHIELRYACDWLKRGDFNAGKIVLDNDIIISASILGPLTKDRFRPEGVGSNRSFCQNQRFNTQLSAISSQFAFVIW